MLTYADVCNTGADAETYGTLMDLKILVPSEAVAKKIRSRKALKAGETKPHLRALSELNLRALCKLNLGGLQFAAARPSKLVRLNCTSERFLN